MQQTLLQKAAQPIEVSDFKLIRNAKVEVTPRTINTGKKIHPVVEIVVNDKFKHTFGENSRITKALQHMEAKDLAARLNGGSYFFINGELVDHRDNQYNGFIHDNSSIEKMIELIGVRPMAPRDRRALQLNASGTQRFALSGVYNKQAIIVPEYLAGGEFESQLMYNWNPFHQNIRGVFELVRLICTNGMVGVSDFMNTNIPMINRWEEHLEIAARQIQNKVADKVQARLKVMSTENATLGELTQIAEHATSRLAAKSEQLPEERDRLTNIYKAVNPVFHLGSVYKPAVFSDTNISAQLPGHLSMFDAFNIATEMYTHTNETEGSSGLALQRIANNLLFDSKAKREQRLSRLSLAPLRSAFSDVKTAFFGDLKVDVKS